MIFPIPKKQTLGEGFFAIDPSLLSPDLLSLYKKIKGGIPAVEIISKKALAEEEYCLSVDGEGVHLCAGSEVGLFRAVTSLYQMLLSCKEKLPFCEIEDAPQLSRRGYMLDISRGRMPKVAVFKRIVDYLAALKYNELQIYMEGHVFKFDSFPQYTAEFDCLNAEDIREIAAYAKERFIDLVPNQNSFGHLSSWLSHDELSHLSLHAEGKKGGTINPLLPESLEFLDKLYGDLLPLHESEYVNIGLDEAVGLGKYQMEEYCKQHGKAFAFMEWLNKIADVCKEKYSKKVQFWSDMIYNYPETYHMIPKGSVALEWGYELIQSQRMAAHCIDFKNAGIDYYVCPSCNTHLSFTGRNDVTTFNIRTAGEIAKEYGAKGLLLTDWGCGCGQPTFLVWSAFPVALAAQYAWNVGKEQDGESFKYEFIKAAEEYVDRVVFGKEGVSELLYRFSNYYLYEPERVHVGTICGESLQLPFNKTKYYHIFDLKNRPYPFYFDNVIDYVKRVLCDFEGVEIDPFLKRQISLNARMVMFSAALCKIRLGEVPDTEGTRALIAEADAIDKEFLLLWNAENYEHGSDEFLSQLRGRRAELSALLSSAQGV